MRQKLPFLLCCVAILVMTKMYFCKKKTVPIIEKNRFTSFQIEQNRLNTLDSQYAIQQEKFIFELLKKHTNVQKMYKENGSVLFSYEKDSGKFDYTINIQPFFEKDVLKAHILWKGKQDLDKMQFLYECHNGKWSEIYADQKQDCMKFADVNGDKYNDVLIRHYPICGHTTHNWVEVLLYNPIKKQVLPANNAEFHRNYLSNPVFYPKKGIALCNETCNPTVTNNVYEVKFENYKWHFVERIYIPFEGSCGNKYHLCKTQNIECKNCPTVETLPQIYENLEVYETNDSVFFEIK